MEEYLIRPWAGEIPSPESDNYVPPELDELALEVCSSYDQRILNKTLITTKPDKGGAIWKIETDQGPRSLKVLHRKPSRSLFSIGAQDYVVRQGARVPELKESTAKALYVEKGGKLWIVTDWIENLTPASKDITGAEELCYGLAEFHQHSRGYIPPLGSQRASRLYRWPAYYQKIIKKFNWFRNIALAYKHLPSSKSLLAMLEIFEQQALAALSQFEQSSYYQLIAKGEEHWGLVHQDFGWSNGQLGPGGLWVIDLDGVAYDLPIRDLRKLISSVMDDLGRWDITWIRKMIHAYHEANPLDRETYAILVNDLSFPNEFYKETNEILFEPESFIINEVNAIIQRLAQLDETKQRALAELEADPPDLLAGSYSLSIVAGTKVPEIMSMKFQRIQVDPNPVRKPTSSEPKRQPSAANLNNVRPKVLMICTEKLPVPPVRGGAIQTYIEGISGFISQKHDLTILGTTDPSLPADEIKNSIRYVRIEGGQIFEVYAQKVVEFLTENCFDLIHVFNRPRFIPLIRTAAPDARLILSMHNDMFNTDKIHKKDALTAISEVERIITVSDYVANTICKLYPQAATKVQTIYSGVNTEIFCPWEQSGTAAHIRAELRNEYGLGSKTVILFIGRLTPKKGADLLIQAMNKVHAAYPDIALVIVGGAWYSDNTVTDYVAYVHTLAERALFPIITTGYVAADLIHQWFWAGDIFVCPSQWQEPLARVHYEAMAAGLPFITTARGGNPEVVIEQNGLIVDQPEDPNEFAEKLGALIANPVLRQSMGRTGRKLAATRFGWERVANEVLSIWKQKVPKKTKRKNLAQSHLANTGDDAEGIIARNDTASSAASSTTKSAVSSSASGAANSAVNGAETLTPKHTAPESSKPVLSSVIRITRDMIRYQKSLP